MDRIIITLAKRINVTLLKKIYINSEIIDI